LTVASVAQAFQARVALDAVAAAPVNALSAGDVTLTIRNPKLVLETVTFTDAVLRSLSMTSASSGLEIPFTAVHYSQAPMRDTSMSVQINRGLSRANMAIVRPYPVIVSGPGGLSYDSNKTYYIPSANPAGGGGFQTKLGAEFMPNKPIDNPLQMYHNTQMTFNNWKSDRRNTVTIADYAGRGITAGAARFNAAPESTAYPNAAWPVQSCLGIYAQTLEKSALLVQSGSPISAARDLNLTWGPTDAILQYLGAQWGGLMVDIFIPYTTLATVFLDSILTRS
jgi:hypothetical protein